MHLVSIFVGLFLVVSSVKGLFLKSSLSDTGLSAIRKGSRWNVPWLGIGLWCNGCPATGCEDDEAIIHGYCCGCAYALDVDCGFARWKSGRINDSLPVLCPQFLQCPLNLHGLCHDYEYMMRCCC